MSVRGVTNSLAIVVLLVAVVGFTYALRPTTKPTAPRTAHAHVHDPVTIEHDASGVPGLRDSRGVFVPIRPYERIVAASTISSEILQELIEPSRVAAWSLYAREHEHSGWKFSDRPTIAQVSDVEAILALRADLVLFNSHANAAAIQRLRERGVAVYDLGPMVGMQSFLKQAEEIATLVGITERYEPYAYHFRRRMTHVQCKPIDDPQHILYIAMFSNAIFGGTIGTSYHDVITSAGLIDAAAESYTGWPDFTPETLLVLDPPWIVTSEGTRATICSHGTLRGLQACRDDGAHVVELPGDILGDGGGGMLLAAELLFDAVYGPCPHRDLYP